MYYVDAARKDRRLPPPVGAAEEALAPFAAEAPAFDKRMDIR